MFWRNSLAVLGHVLGQGNRAKAAGRRPGARPRLEPLEGRLLLTVFGPDDRTPVQDTTAAPWSAVGEVIATFPDGKSFQGTGALVGGWHVLTAAHMVYEAGDGGWATAVEFIPGRNGNSAPFGAAWATGLRTYTTWASGNDQAWDYDLALVTLDHLTGAGRLGLESQPDSFFDGGTLTSAGYPADLGGGQSMDSISGPVSGVTAGGLMIAFAGSLDTAPGQSGSPMWRDGPGGPAIDAVIDLENSTANYAVRLTPDRVADLQAWMAQDGSGPAPGGLVCQLYAPDPPPAPAPANPAAPATGTLDLYVPPAAWPSHRAA